MAPPVLQRPYLAARNGPLRPMRGPYNAMMVPLFITKALHWLLADWRRLLTTVGIIALGILVVVGFIYCQNRRIDKTRDEVIREQINANRFERRASELEEEANRMKERANEALKNVEEIENRTFNANLDEANRARCRAFPDSRECRGNK